MQVAALRDFRQLRDGASDLLRGLGSVTDVPERCMPAEYSYRESLRLHTDVSVRQLSINHSLVTRLYLSSIRSA